MNISWLLTRLSKMPLPEIPWRVFEKAKKIADKKTSFSCPQTTALPDKRIFLLAKHSDAKQLKRLFPDAVAHHFVVADAALENRFDAFGIKVLFAGDIDWHLDPVTKGRWPEKFWGDIDYRDKSLGGVKFVWEYNRLYFLFSLGLCFRLSGDEKYAKHVCRIIRSWLEANPYPVGVNWASGIEAGVRMANLVWALGLLEGYAFSEKDLAAVNCFVWLHGRHLHRYPSRYSSANNHLLAEAFGLFAAGLYFPHLPGADRWLAAGRKMLDKEAGRQILADGGSFEYSTTYLSFVFDFFLFYRHMSQTCGMGVGEMVDRRLESACMFISSIMDQNGHVPNIGDQDSAVLAGFGVSNRENFSSVLNTGAVIFDRPELAAGRPDIKTWLLCGKTPRENQAQKLRAETVLHEQSGLGVIRDHVDEKEVLFVGNAMPLGMAPLYAHGHLDALSLTLFLDGKAIFVDPGTYLYHSGGKWRQYFRSTAAHNTVRLNETELSAQTGDFMFGRPYHILEHWLEKQGVNVVWCAGHDAYMKKALFAKVGREVVWDKARRCFLIRDHVEAKQGAFVEVFFHCHPDSAVNKTAECFWVGRGDAGVWLYPDNVLESEVVRGSETPVMGWYSSGFNEIAPCAVIRCFGTVKKNVTLVTRLELMQEDLGKQEEQK